MTNMRIDNKTILITGATGGVGLSLANEFLNFNVSLILADIDPQDKLVSFEKRDDVSSIKMVNMDLTSYESIELGLQELGDDIKKIDILINNAGQFIGGLIEDQNIMDVYKMFHVNLVGQIHLINRILPYMLQRDEAMIVNNVGVKGITNFPCETTYTASKSGLLAFSEALRRELLGTNVCILTLITPAVDTPQFQKAKEVYGNFVDVNKWKAISPQEWARNVIDAIRKNKLHLYPDGRIKILLFIARHFPFLYDLYCRRNFSRYKSSL